MPNKIITNQRREILLSDRTYYVRTDGNDANDGLTNTAGGAFATIQTAFQAVESLDCNGFIPTVKIGDGTYNLTDTVEFPLITAAPYCVVEGNTTDASLVTFSKSTDGILFQLGIPSTFEIGGFTLSFTNNTLNARDTINFSDNVTVRIVNDIILTNPRYAIVTSGNAFVRIEPTNTVSLTTDANSFFRILANGYFQVVKFASISSTTAFTGNLVFGGAGGILDIPEADAGGGFAGNWSNAVGGTLRYSALRIPLTTLPVSNPTLNEGGQLITGF